MTLLFTALLAASSSGQDGVEVERLLDRLIGEDGIVQFFDDEFPDIAKFGWSKAAPGLCRIASGKNIPYRYFDGRKISRESYDEQMKDLAISALGKSGEAAIAIKTLKGVLQESSSTRLKESALASLYLLGEKRPLEDFLKKTDAEATESIEGPGKDDGCSLLFTKALMLTRVRRRDEAEVTFVRIVQAIEAHRLRQSADTLLPTVLYNLASLRAIKKEKAKAIEWLEKAIRAGFRDREFIRADKDLDCLRDEEGYKKLMANEKLFEPPK